MGYVFISYSSKNKEKADLLRNILISNNIEPWMAPYSINSGEKYAAAITNAIRNCECFVLLLSNDAQMSDGVDGEVELAAKRYKKEMVILEIEPTVLNDSFEYYIGNKQIIPIDRKLSENEQFNIALRRIGSVIDCFEPEEENLFVQEKTQNNTTLKLIPGKTIEFGKIYNTPILWKVVSKDEDKYLLVCTKSLCLKQFNNEFIPTTWEHCSIRKWLNGEFLSTAFSKDESEIIIQTITNNAPNSQYGTPAGNTTSDYVFLLSVNEVITYTNLPNESKEPVWLRTPGGSATRAVSYNFSTQKIDYYGNLIDSESTGIQPAIWVRY